MKASIINVTGYAGMELTRLLYNHPEVTLVEVTARSAADQKLSDVFPHLNSVDLVIQEDLSESADVIFSALPHKASAEALEPLIAQKKRVIDISADFRLNDKNIYQKWYEVDHPCPEYLHQAVYGLPELYKSELQTALLVANPGCYPTSAILALAPAISAGLIQPSIIIDSKSGVSGAGRTLSHATHFSETNENVAAYGLSGHRHLPEITQELSKLQPDHSLGITFIPHLIPMTRGILSTCYGTLLDDRGLNHSHDSIVELYKEFFRDCPFVKITNQPPGTKQTLGSNFCLIYPTVDQQTGRLVVISCLDNLVKGAAGQAIQNMNIMFNLQEDTGLQNLAVFP